MLNRINKISGKSCTLIPKNSSCNTSGKKLCCLCSLIGVLVCLITSFTNVAILPQPLNQLLLRKEVTEEHNYVTVGLNRPLLERVAFYNYVLNVYRNKTLQQLAADAELAWPNSMVGTIYYEVDSFLKQIANDNVTHVTTVYLRYLGPPLEDFKNWDSRAPEMAANFLVHDYYDWVGPAPHCAAIDNEDRGVRRWTYFVESSPGCQNNTSVARPSYKTTSINSSLVRYQMVGGMADTVPYLTYVHIIRRATVVGHGHVFAGNFKIVQPMCFESFTDYKVDLKAESPNVNQNNFYDEVFVIAQTYGYAYFHKNVENMPRLALVLQFLKDNPHIRIHVSDGVYGEQTNSLFKSLNLDSKRKVMGDVHANIVYLPRSAMCDKVNMVEGQVISLLYRNYIVDTPRSPPLSPEDLSWNSVVLIQRTGERRLKMHDEAAKLVKTVAEKYGRRYELFADNPSPSIDETMLIFYRARVIVAPHGAGLSHMLFSRPGTFIIEGMSESPFTIACFVYAAHHLGLSHFGIPSRGGYPAYIDVDPTLIANTLDDFLANLH